MLSMLVRGPFFADTFRYTMQGLSLAPIFLFVLSFPASWVVRGLEHGWVRWIGRRSYAMYLIHVCIIQAITQRLGLNPVLAGVAAAPLVLGYGWAMAKCVEQPLARLKRTLESPHKAAAGVLVGAHAGGEER